MMLERMQLSIANGWFDEKNRAFIYYKAFFALSFLFWIEVRKKNVYYIDDLITVMRAG